MTPQRTIGWLAKSAGVHVQTIRYYERQQLLSPGGRRSSGYRVYGHAAVARLRFIRNAKALGFTLREIGELLRLRVNGRARCGDVQRKAEAKLHGVEAKLTDLQALARALRGLIRMCQAGQPIDHCQILRQMEREQPASQQSQKRRTS